jgi:hypothetical protein
MSSADHPAGTNRHAVLLVEDDEAVRGAPLRANETTPNQNAIAGHIFRCLYNMHSYQRRRFDPTYIEE